MRRAVEDAAASVAVGVGRRRDEVGGVEPQIDSGIVELARPDRPDRSDPIRLGQLGAPLLTPVWSETLNGRPVVSVVIPDSASRRRGPAAGRPSRSSGAGRSRSPRLTGPTRRCASILPSRRCL